MDRLYNPRMSSNSYTNNQSNISNNLKDQIKYPVKLRVNKNPSNSNGISKGNLTIPYNTKSVFKIESDESLNQSSQSDQGSVSFQKESLNSDRSNEIRMERKMPNLIRETEIDQCSTLLTTTVFNQRFQNVQQFPNYRHKKKRAFERKLKHCGLQLDGEITISYLRQFLQPFIYRDINIILDEYIEKYFVKAFENIRENINMTSDNWSQILKCSFSKSVYKQYCNDATIDPFDPISTDISDFPCFPNEYKVSNMVPHKNSIQVTDVSVKSEIDSFTVPGVTSDTNSEYSNVSDRLEINQTDNHFCDKINNSSYLDPNTRIKSNQPHCLKRNIEINKVQENLQVSNSTLDEHKCSSPKLSKATHTNQSINQCHVHNLPGNSDDATPSKNSSHPKFHMHNNNYQKYPNSSESLYSQIQPQTARFDNKKLTFFNNANSSSQNRNLLSVSAIQPGNYLNSSHRSIENNSSNNQFFQTT